MTTTTDSPETRTIETEMDLPAPVEEVWKALTDPQELTRWFPLQARVTPGQGGAIWYSWGPPWEGENRIDIWEPPRHLRTTWFSSEKEGAQVPIPLTVDFYLEGRGGTTRLRLVHSGFGAGADWDEEYDGVRRGWAFELRSLRHYFQHHRGRSRAVAWPRVEIPPSVSWEQAWQRITGPDGLNIAAALASSRPGAAYSATTALGDRMEGEVLMAHPPRDFGFTVRNWNQSLLRLDLVSVGGKREAGLWLSRYDGPDAELRRFDHRWRNHLTRLLGS